MTMEESPSRYDQFRSGSLCKRLDRSFFAKNIVFRETLASTNTLARELAVSGAPGGTVVLTEEQTAGKGRMGRKWLSPPHVNLLFSLLLRPRMHLEDVFLLTMALALATISGIYEMCRLNPMIKWPNDLYASGKKLGGMLSEFSARGRSLDYVVLGLGLNVNWKPSKEKVGRYPATSILCETGRKVSREDLLVHILKRFESHYLDVQAGKTDTYYERWNDRSMLLGRRVELRTSTGRVCGKAIRTERNGALVVLDDQGQERKIVSGDVTVEGIGDESSGERANF